MSNNNRRRVKLFVLNSECQWADHGTGHVSAMFTDQENESNGIVLLVRSEEDGMNNDIYIVFNLFGIIRLNPVMYKRSNLSSCNISIPYAPYIGKNTTIPSNITVPLLFWRNSITNCCKLHVSSSYIGDCLRKTELV